MNINFLLNNKLSNDIAIDIGADSTKIFMRDGGIVLDEPSYIAYDNFTKKIVAIGNEAYEMLGKTPKALNVQKPIVRGIVADFELAVELIKRFIQKVYSKTVLKPRIITSVPSGSTEVEKRAITNVLEASGAREVYLIEEPLSAASGAGCDISLARGMLIADIGDARCDVASISLGNSVISKSITTAGEEFTKSIIDYVRSKYNTVIGYTIAKDIKHQIGCACPFEYQKFISCYGCDATSGRPVSVNVGSEEIRDLLYPKLKEIANLIISVLEETPTTLQSDILEDGVLITGGSAKLYGIEKLLRNETGLKVYVAENPDKCVINGMGQELLKFDLSNAPSEKYYYSLNKF